jgi:formate dehydrogenase iron-sulfur subunit
MGTNRRDFFKLIGVTGCTALLGTARKAGSTEDFAGWPDRYGVLTDTTMCVGCRSCEEACNAANDLPKPKVPFDDLDVLDEERRPEANAYTVVNRFQNPKDPDWPITVKIQCMHCNEPACASACLVKALKKTPEGAVTYNEDVCIGCRYCMAACPFYVPAYDYSSALEPKIAKCTLCYDRIKEGGVTACAEACPAEAILFGKRNELIEIARQRIRENPDTYVNHIYGEYEAGGTSWMYLSAVPFEKIGFHADVGKKPYPEYTRGFLTAVPGVLVIWPALLGGFYAFTKRKEEITAGENASRNREEGE